jgi:hypothetical protein
VVVGEVGDADPGDLEPLERGASPGVARDRRVGDVLAHGEVGVGLVDAEAEAAGVAAYAHEPIAASSNEKS